MTVKIKYKKEKKVEGRIVSACVMQEGDKGVYRMRM